MSFFTEEAKARIVKAVQDVESKSSAEIVVSVRGRSDDYRDIDVTAGVLVAIVVLALLIYHPAELDEDLMPVETLLAFVLGSLLVNKVPALKRALLSKTHARKRAETMARAQFVEGGVGSTKGRSGILVFVSELERLVCVVPDVGIDPARLGDAWKKALADLDAAATDLAAFTHALTALGPVLAAAYPRAEDDENELPDMVLAS